MSLSALAIRRPVTTAMFFIGTGLLGFVSLGQLRVELLPEVVYPEIFVSLNQRTLSPEQAERQLAMPAEAEVGQLDGIVELNSTASQGRAQLQISFSPATDMKFALLQVQNRMDRLQPLLPEQTTIGVQRFDTSALSAAVMEIQVLGEGDLNWLREFSEQKIRPELEAVEGVVSATVLGGQRRAVEIIIDPDLLEAQRLSPNRVSTAINAANRPRAYVGSVFYGNQAYPVSLRGQFTALEEIRDVVLEPAVPLRLGDVALVRRGLQERTDISRVNGASAVNIRILKEDEANLIEVAAELEATIARLNGELAPETIELTVVNNQAELMQGALDTLVQAALVGAALGLAVLFLFLRNARFVTLLLLAIPSSLLLTFNLMYAWDLSLNVLSICGLALAVGMLADNGIVVMEAIFKHFERGKDAAKAALDGTAEVSKAVVAATATTVMVFLPVVFIENDFQEVLRDLALSIAFPLAASLLVALTLVPMLGARTLARGPGRSLGTGRLLEMYTVVLKAALRHRARVTVAIGVTLAVTLIAAFFLMLQQEAVQEESQFTVYADLPEGATLEATDEVVRRIEEAVRELEGIDGFTSSVTEGMGSVTVRLVEPEERPEGLTVDVLKDRLEEHTEDIRGAVVGYDPPATGGIGGGGGGGGGGGRRSAGFSLALGQEPELAAIRGDDFSILQMIADDLVYRLQEVEEIDANSVRADVQRSAPEVQILPDPVAMFDRDIEVSTLLGAVEGSSVDGFRAATAFLEADGTETAIDVRPTEDPETEAIGLDDLRRLPILTPSGEFTPMEEVARVRTDEGRRSILRTDQSRRVIVEYQFIDGVLDSQPQLDAARRLVRTVVQGLALPDGYSIDIDESQVDTIYYWMMGIAALLVYMILASLFESMWSPVVVFATLPTAAIGSCWALILSGTGLASQAGPMALLGLIVLIGIAVNNGIILIDAISALRSRRGFRRERAVLVAGRSRVRPILMTSATTLLGVLPLALEYGGDYEIWPPFAITILGGLSVSMVSTLVFVPVAYMGIDQVREWLRDIGWLGVSLATAATIAASWGFHWRYESLFWTALAVLPLWFAFVTAVWVVLRVHGLRLAARRARRPIHALRLHTLTKVYGAPGRFRREWGRFARRAALRLAAGEYPVDPAAIREGFTWKVPLLGLMVFLHAYFADPVWLYLLSLATVALLYHLGHSLALLARPEWAPVPEVPGFAPSLGAVESDAAGVGGGVADAGNGGGPGGGEGAGDGGEAVGDGGDGHDVRSGDAIRPATVRPAAARPPRAYRVLAALGRHGLAASFFVYVHWRVGLLSVTLASVGVWVLLSLVRLLADRVRYGDVDPERIRGRLAWVRRNVYLGVSKLPILGVPPRPFEALAGVDLDIGRGMFGLLGPNGAGKTTLMRIVCQVLEPTYGSVSLNGVNVDEWDSLQGVIGYLPQHFGLYDHMTAVEYLEYRALLEGFREREERRERVRWCLEQVHLLDRKDDRIGSYSGGMRQRVGIAQTLLHTPQVIVVDEPTAGLDPVERIRFRNLLARLSRERIVVFSTHIVEDVAGSCNRLAVLANGRVLYVGSPAAMRELARDRVWEAVLPEDDFHAIERKLRLITHLRTPRGIRARFLAREPLAGIGAEPVEPTLEDAYIQLLEQSRGGSAPAVAAAS